MRPSARGAAPCPAAPTIPQNSESVAQNSNCGLLRTSPNSCRTKQQKATSFPARVPGLQARRPQPAQEGWERKEARLGRCNGQLRGHERRGAHGGDKDTGMAREWRYRDRAVGFVDRSGQATSRSEAMACLKTSRNGGLRLYTSLNQHSCRHHVVISIGAHQLAHRCSGADGRSIEAIVPVHSSSTCTCNVLQYCACVEARRSRRPMHDAHAPRAPCPSQG